MQFWFGLLIVLSSTLAEEVEKYSPAFTHESSTASNGVLCRIPINWQGDWYQYSEHTIDTPLVNINESHVSGIGGCGRLPSNGHGDGQKQENVELLLISKDRSGSTCWLCMLVFERHHNILQYRISQKCVGDPDEACNEVDINLPMRIMFRANAAVVACPISWQANFSFSTAMDIINCDSNQSRIETCADESRLQFNYVPCPNMRMHARTDEISCIGQFEYSNKKYFVGKITNQQYASSEGDLHRCFMYDTTSAGGTVFISADASCQSLDLGEPDMRIQYVKNETTPKSACSFHTWMRRHGHNKDDEIGWESLSTHGDRHVFNRHQWTVTRMNGMPRTTAMKDVHTINYCIHHQSDPESEKSITPDGTKKERIIVYSIQECTRGYRCVEFYHNPKRTRNQIMDVMIGKFAPEQHKACTDEYFDTRHLLFETLIDAASKEQECPLDRQGQYRIRGCDQNDALLFFGCGDHRNLIFYDDCNHRDPSVYQCYGDWIDPENPLVHYLAVRDLTNGRKTCFAYSKKSEDNELSISTFKQHSCRRGILPGVNWHRTYNLTKTGECGPIPLHIANLTQIDASTRYEESSLSARSVNHQLNSAALNHSIQLLLILMIGYWVT